jgi:hypothetical protein
MIVLGDREATVHLLDGRPDVSEIAPPIPRRLHPGADSDALHTIFFRAFSDDAGLADILRALLEAGASVVSFTQQRDNLEEIFMQ